MSICTLTVVEQPQRFMQMTLSRGNEEFHQIFDTIADDQNVFSVIDESPYMRVSSQRALTDFFSELYVKNQEKLENFLPEQKAKILYTNYRNYIIAAAKAQTSYKEKTDQISKLFQGINTDLNTVSDEYLVNYFDSFYQSSPKIAFKRLLKLKNLQFNLADQTVGLDAQIELKMPRELMQQLCGKSK